MNWEDNGELPEGWTLCDLPQVAEIVMGQSPPGSTYNDDGIGLPFFQGKADFGVLHPTARKWCTAPTKLAQSGDILITIRAPVGPTNIATEKCAIGRGLSAIRARGSIENRWLLYALRLQESHLAEQGTGSTFTAINREHLDAVELPLPPLAEQGRIVAAVEAVLAKVNAARDRLNRLPAILKRLRQAVLSAACSSRLTADWREQHPTTEPAVVLIARHRQPDELRQLDTSRLPEIPETWAWLALPDTGEMNRGKSRHRPRNAPHLYGGRYPFIQTGDIANSGGRIRGHKQTYSEAGLQQSRLWEAGTVCITIAANIADSAMLTYPACFPDSVVGVVTTPEFCDAEYLEYFLRTAREDLAAFAPATAQANINIAILNDLAVPLPPFAEQQEIVRRVGELFALADVIEARLTDARQMADQLTQAVLAKAFRGELVPTEAELARRENRTYEPAADLLARIRADRDQPAAPANGKPTRTRKPRSGT